MLYGYYVAVASNWQIKDGSDGTENLDIDKGSQYSGITVYDNTVFGTKLFFFSITSLSSFTDLALLLLRTNSDGHIEDVQNIFILPNLAIDASKLTQHTASVGGQNFSFYTMAYDMEPETFDTTINKLNTFSDFVPKNRKMFCISIQLLICYQ